MQRHDKWSNMFFTRYKSKLIVLKVEVVQFYCGAIQVSGLGIHSYRVVEKSPSLLRRDLHADDRPHQSRSILPFSFFFLETDLVWFGLRCSDNLSTIVFFMLQKCLPGNVGVSAFWEQSGSLKSKLSMHENDAQNTSFVQRLLELRSDL